jgi:hypothetical protein
MGSAMEKLLLLLWNIEDVVREHASPTNTRFFTLTSSYVYMAPFRMCAKMLSV